ncbi:nucleotidyltransferase family protein [Crocinitomix algicola]|uniref:nucleotidyltransferase family protein n=1 Tax=Crocinitomix algicola TaxID=1740263 RepID=UPI0009F55E25|nr:nucleotidyltransferase family protein [Crocinitomix algicola]
MLKQLEIDEIIILAGGLGTRLRSEIGAIPKPLAPVCEKPFIVHLLDYLAHQQLKTVILSVGYKWEMIKNVIGDAYKGMKILYSVEKEPLGTGGAIKLALNQTKRKHVLACNGDTLFTINLNDLKKIHLENNSLCTLALKPIKNTDRYGSVQINEKQKIIGFTEKQFQDTALINGGIYCLNKSHFNKITPQKEFSFEKEFLEIHCNENLYGSVQNTYFIDIGIPKDFKQLNTDLKNKTIHELK